MSRQIFASTWFSRSVLAAAVIAAGATFHSHTAAAEEGIAIPAPKLDEKAGKSMETAVFAGGCFWGVQGVFQHVNGVTEAISGYTGGAAKDAVYEVVGTGETGHAESVKLTFDPRKISYGHLLQIYFSVAHDPTELNRQGPDTGTQYRSTVFPVSEDQARVAKAYIAELDKDNTFGTRLATTVEPGRTFYRAEDYHQNFLTLNPTYPYIVYNDMPKIENLKRLFPRDYRGDPVLVKVSAN